MNRKSVVRIQLEHDMQLSLWVRDGIDSFKEGKRTVSDMRRDPLL